MYSTVDYSVTPRPMYPADGRKIPDVYTAPGSLRDELQSKLGTFPLFEFWGPRAGIRSTRWIADAAMLVDRRFNPTLTLIYLPHLDYNLQRVGPGAAVKNDLREVDAVCADLIRYYESHRVRVVVLSEYGIRAVLAACSPESCVARARVDCRPRRVRSRDARPGASAAFAVADHQVAHIYVNDRSRLNDVRAIVERVPGIEAVLGAAEKQLATSPTNAPAT
jgi:predicted AlkP superfamily pyrophosphatase or phosphodiesterase